jgi:hypothetical protein
VPVVVIEEASLAERTVRRANGRFARRVDATRKKTAKIRKFGLDGAARARGPKRVGPVPMACHSTAQDELATLYLPRVEKQTLPPPLPPPMRPQLRVAPLPPPLPAVMIAPSSDLPPPIPPPASLVVPRATTGIGLALSQATLVIELQLSELNDHELAQITSFLRERQARVVVRQNRLADAAARVVSAARAVRSFGSFGSVRARLRGAVERALLWTLARLGNHDAKTSGTFARSGDPQAPPATGQRLG